MNNKIMDNQEKDLWETIQERISALGGSIIQGIIALLLIVLWAYAPAVAINLFFPRIELSLFHSALIAAGIGLLILIKAWWEHKSRKKNE